MDYQAFDAEARRGLHQSTSPTLQSPCNCIDVARHGTALLIEQGFLGHRGRRRQEAKWRRPIELEPRQITEHVDEPRRVCFTATSQRVPRKA